MFWHPSIGNWLKRDWIRPHSNTLIFRYMNCHLSLCPYWWFVFPCFSQPRVPYGMATMPAGAAVPGMAAVPGVAGMSSVAGMTAVPAGMARVPNGIGGLYQAEKPTSLYPAYHSLGQPGYLAQASPSGAGQTSFLGATQSGYLSASSPTSQQRYMVSPTYPGAGALGAGPSVLAGIVASCWFYWLLPMTYMPPPTKIGSYTGFTMPVSSVNSIHD